MNRFFPSPAGFAVVGLFPETVRKNTTLRDILLVLGCLAVVSFGLLFWAAFFRKRRRHRSGHSHHSHHHGRAASVGESGGEPRRRSHRHRHRRRSSNYPPNPTLAQTGGLPPIRRDEPPGSPQQPGMQPP